MGENTHQNCTRQNKNKEDPGRQQPCWGLLFCTNLTQPTGALDSHSSQMLLSTIQEMNEQMDATILMVTHDAFSASYANRILFLRDGEIYKEIMKGSSSRKEFFEQILEVLNTLGGGVNDVR